MHWLLQRLSVSASVALVDLRTIDVSRHAELERLAAMALDAMLPTVLVGASDEEGQRATITLAELLIH